ncbi:malate dehydrogenase [Rhodococcus fascians]|uniref:malate dehydrogenase n=1 Tax=Rhodococcoides fascians TaxID=1828 RepID=UPI00196177D3|nr:malate dehydrogenase [Rhodococcus fascians]MBM7244431.1 malate dehydrogenase [Rhodococcus fascians]MBY3808043.1 malate dehydrogenase [Rhodococcus fascians]MBY3839591.1 malate dehydrogenase [Rhodococcus fascians]MBY3847854.1 malate dehydrogenase [Rhodococcus fascians]MBY3851354.1 malate dehydrogenase [Rhodococcus fascians]
MNATKVTIFGGAGGIGSSIAFNLLLRPSTYDVVIVDTKPNMVTSHVMDLQDVAGIDGSSTVRGGSAQDAADSEIVILSAAVPLRLNASRSVFLEDNARIVEALAVPLIESGWNGTLIMLTNPADALSTWLHQRTGFDRRKLLGYTINDSLRLRTGVGRALGVSPHRVEGWVLGEHGAGQVPLYDSILVDGSPVHLDDEQRAIAQNYIDTWYVEHVALDSGRTSTWSSGRGTALLVDAIATESDSPLPASVVLDGEYGVHGASLGVPVLLGRSGVRSIVEWDLSSSELAALRAGGDSVRAAAEGISLD